MLSESTAMGSIGFAVFIVMTVGFFAWVAYLAVSK